MLALIIPGEESVTSENVDVYLWPFIEKLQLLWNGVQTFDVSSKENFNLRAMCIWNVHDFPTYELFAGCVTKGHIGCPPCGLAIDFHSSKKLKKMIFCGNHWYLPKSHPYWRNKNTFNGETEMKGPFTWVFASNIVKWVEEWKLWLQGPRNRVRAK
jgi:hypothetical protein